jgi:foldase protein PrsA
LKLHKLPIALILTLLLMTSIPVFAADITDDEIVAIINDRKITRSEYIETMEQEVGVFVMRQMIFRELVRQKQNELGITVNPQEFELYLAQTIAEMVHQLGGETYFLYYLDERKMTEETFIEMLELEYILYLCAVTETTVTPEEVTQFFEDNRIHFNHPEMVRASHILVGTEAEADDLVNKLKEGADFAELARTYSIDTQTGPFGGDLGYFAKGEMVSEFENLSWSLGVDQFNKVSTAYGWHVVLVTDKRAPQEANLEEQWDEVESTLIHALATEYLGAYLYQLEQEANIEVFLDHILP